jgi:hypothetical protein
VSGVHKGEYLAATNRFEGSLRDRLRDLQFGGVVLHRILNPTSSYGECEGEVQYGIGMMLLDGRK